MEHDENAFISDVDGTVGHDEGPVDADPEETTLNPYILARNMHVAQLKQRLAEVEGSAQEFRHFMNSATMQGRKKTNKKSTQKVVDGRTLGHQSKKRSTRNAGKPHRHVVEEEGSSTSAASSERDTSCSSDYSSRAEESEGSELPVASSVMKEQNKAPSKRTPTPNVSFKWKMSGTFRKTSFRLLGSNFESRLTVDSCKPAKNLASAPWLVSGDMLSESNACSSSPTLGKVGDLESSGTPECSELDSRTQNTSHWGVLGVIGKVLKRRYRKCPRIGHLDISRPSYGQKKGRESNWQFDSRPLKVGNRPLPEV
ncbi:unnamed protein product [Sphagnum jensenii]|uniref:Uncharacterized protein n=1 Tax=Sphagnum jensenii TaxID=128206 RepID=A0ABP0ZX85_9BRYO